MEVLKEKVFKEYDYLSRYSSFPCYYNTVDKKYMQGLTSNLADDTVYVLHKVTAGETLDSIALDNYANSTYFWVIADFNRIKDPYVQLKEGETLKIPTLGDIHFKEN